MLINRSKEEESKKWEILKSEKKNLPTWVILCRKNTTINVLEYKIAGGINSSAQACISSFKKNIHNQADNIKNKKYPTYDILDKSKDSLLTYVIHKEPFPSKNTEMSVRYIFFDEMNGNTGVRWKEAWDECQTQPSKKLNRVQTFRGSWDFTIASSNRCVAVNNIQFDLNEMTPWLVGKKVVKYLVEGLENIREMNSK